uniref:Potassium channel toxin alpha-KTx 14.1 n=1 Tax=Olivierus martensii TaxID=34649 RepID=KA141_OLIMR|nr:RecName: Full=Potassium channel toxin alpha-KTx 14.1; AltName: Full=BmKK1; AltName: Full=Toxin Kk1; Flags: Precursor [Mesobuthus martensii]CAC38035.1 K+ toxin-like peptide [Mesobuthus martensii]
MKIFFAILLILAVCSMAIWTVNGTPFAIKCATDADCSRKCPGNPSCRNGFCACT